MIKRTQGQKGELLIKPLTEHPEERFRQGSELFMARKREEERLPAVVVDSRVSGRGPIIKLEGVNSREDAWPLFGASLFIRGSQLSEPGPDSYYAFQLEGCEVYAGDRRIGVVTALKEPPKANPYLEIDPGGGEPLTIIPFVSEVVTSVDLRTHRIGIAEGFLRD